MFQMNQAMFSMDPLQVAACSGNVDFLRGAVASAIPQYFLTEYTPSDENENVAGNIFHLAAWNKHVEFIRVAMEILPTEILQILLCQRDKDDWNPLHVAACVDPATASHEMVKLFLGFFKSPQFSGQIENNDKPWLATTVREENQTALHMAIGSPIGWREEPNEESALEILSMDLESLCIMEDYEGNSPLYYAITYKCTRVAERIFMSSCSYSLSGYRHSTVLHWAQLLSEDVLRLVLEKHPELMDVVDDKGYTMLHQWAAMASCSWPFDVLLKEDFPAARTKVFTDLIYRTTEKEKGESPLHIAARYQYNIDVGRALIDGYKQEMKAAGKSLDCNPPWKIKNNEGNTPLMLALFTKNEDFALHLMSVDPTLCQIYGSKGISPLHYATYKGCGKVVEEILRTQDVCFSMLRSNDGYTVLHCLRDIPENIGRKLLQKFWWIINLPNDMGKTALDYAKEANTQWLIHLLMNPSLIEKEPFDWVTACEKDETVAVRVFIDHCEDLQKVWRENKDTPLHHIKSLSYKDYVILLKNPSIAELKNTIDYEGATPLHRALEREDMQLAKALLVDDGVERNIEDYQGRTAMSLLANLCKKYQDWEEMCKQIKVNPNLRTTYIQPGTDLDQMRNTLSVVAALLATITFAAGFTLPGGLNSETGQAIMAKNAAFLVFLLADAYAMCTSMLVLFCLIWSMVSNRDMSYLLVDRSVLILMQALYGTMVAFMTGIYAMIAHSSLWAAVIILIMCAFIGISANRTVLHNILAKLVPTANQDQKDRARFLEEGKSIISRSSRNQVQEDQNPLLQEGKNAEGASSIPLRKPKSFLRQKALIPSSYQNLKDPLPLLDEEIDDSHTVEGISSNPHQNSTSFVRKKNVIPEENEHDKEDQIQQLEEGRAFMSGDDETKANSEIKFISEG